MFTDYGFDAIALPRNRELPGNRDRRVLRSRSLRAEERRGRRPSDEQCCASFRTPSLRNVAVRDSFGHNGVYKTLREVVAFYARRAVAPDRIYPPGQKFDDVPPKYRGNVNIYAPIYNRRGGRAAAALRRGHRRDRRVPGDADRRARTAVAASGQSPAGADETALRAAERFAAPRSSRRPRSCSPRVAPERRALAHAVGVSSGEYRLDGNVALRRSRDGRSGAGAPAARDRHEPRRLDRRRGAGGRTRRGRRARSPGA